MNGTILVPLDGSALARHALPYAALLAQASQARLILLHAYRSKTEDSEADPELDLVVEHADLASGLRERGVHASTWLSYDEAGPSIVKAAADLHADLIVMSTHGRGGLSQLVYGSVAEHVLRQTSVPVVLAKSGPRWPDDLPLRILVPLDGSALSESALEPASKLARALGANLVLLRVSESHHDDVGGYLESVAAPRRADGLTIEARVEAGSPAEAIARAASEAVPTLVVMATHGRGALIRLLLGSVASEALRKLTAPVLLVRPHQDAESASPTQVPVERLLV
jgi:nucleotide-binding universal stress UspA family protein